MNSENESSKESRYQEILTKLEETMRRSNNAYGTISTALNMTVEALCAEAGTLWYYDRFGKGFIIPRATYGGALLDTTLLSLGEGVAGKVVETGKATIVADCQKDPRWAGKVDAKTGFTTKSMICVPLSVKGAVFGCIQIINKKDNSAYDEADLKLVSKLAQGISSLFVRYGLLSQYWTKVMGVGGTKPAAGSKPASTAKPAQTAPKAPPKPAGVSFLDVFGAADPAKMEAQLRSVDGFNALGFLEQRAALSAAKKLWRCFGGK